MSAEKVKSANISTERQEVQTSWKGWLILSFKHTPHSDLCLNNKAKCYNLPPPRNIRCIASKRCRIARKDIDGQRKEEKCSASLLFDNKEKLDRKKEVDEVSGAVLHLFKKNTFYVGCLFCRIALNELVAELVVMSMAARFETQYTIVLSTWSASTSSLVIFEDHLPYDPWVMLIRITVDTKSISPCWGTNPSIRLRSSYNLRVTQSYELPISRLRSLDTLPPPQSSKWKYGQGRNSECVSRGWQLVAATLSARPPPKHLYLDIYFSSERWPCSPPTQEIGHHSSSRGIDKIS